MIAERRRLFFSFSFLAVITNSMVGKLTYYIGRTIGSEASAGGHCLAASAFETGSADCVPLHKTHSVGVGCHVFS